MNPFIIRAALLLLIGLSVSAGATVARAQARSEWVYPGPNGKLVYKTTPAGDRIMDFSYAGYMGGGVALPTVPVKKTVQPTGKDDTAVIQAAINEVSALPLENGFRGAVLLAPGTYVCSNAIIISASGVVLRGSGSTGEKRSTIKMAGGRHNAITVRGGGGRGAQAGTEDEAGSVRTTMADAYVPAGAMSFSVADASGFSVGDTIEIRRPVTAEWVKFMEMHNLTRDGRSQTWIRVGTMLTTLRTIAAISGKKMTLDVPLSDSFDSKYLNPPGTAVVKTRPPSWLTQVGVEHLHISSPDQEVNHSQQLYSAMRVNGQDCWVRDVIIDETMNSVSVGGRRITLERVTVNRKARHLGASKPAEFAPNAGQVLLDRCSVNADNVWFSATGGGQAGPIVLLNCTFTGNGRIEGHQRWTTGMLIDSCRLPDGGIDFKNRGAMGSGHGWGTGWSVAWNCVARNYVIQQPPGAYNWAIGCIGESTPMARPFDSSPMLPVGVFDSPGKPVTPQSLYLTQLAERLGMQAVKNIGYDSTEIPSARPAAPSNLRAKTDPVFGQDFGLRQPVNTGNMRNGEHRFSGEMAVDGDESTYWATDDNPRRASIELDMDGPTEINAIALEEAAGMTDRVREYKVEAQVNSDWKLLAQGTTIGARKVDRFPKVTVWKVRLTILKWENHPAIRTFSLFNVKD